MTLGRALPTINFRVDYLGPAIDTGLTAIARVRRSGKSVGVVDVDVLDDKQNLVAIGRATYSTLPPLDRATVHAAFATGTLDPVAVAEAVLARLARRRDDHIWINRFDDRAILEHARRLAAGPKDLPLYGLPFAIKDNIDVAGLDTTAACPAFAYRPARSAPVVERLVAAGALPIGKTNLDQFATGLNGTRSPYGTAVNPIDAAYLPGGSSSGSAVAVSAGLVTFALGTDTAGSGRVPAAFTNIVGVKPTYGLISTAGVVPACASLDCVSIFALTVDDGHAVLAAAAETAVAPPAPPPRALRYAVPRAADLEFFGDRAAATAFAQALTLLDAQGWQRVDIDFARFRETAALLYGGPWVAERLAAIEDFYTSHPDALHPVTRAIIGGAARFSAVDAFRALHRLDELRRVTTLLWRQADVMVVPTAPTIYRLDAFAAEPIELNNRLGIYTNFVNLLGYAALAVPGPWRGDRLPAGITLIGPGGSDAALAGIGRVLHTATGSTMGAGAHRVPAPGLVPEARAAGCIRLAVVGAHLSGLPLNHQLIERGARLVGARLTAPLYRLYALPGTVPPKPGLVRTVDRSGGAIAVELWDIPEAAFGGFVDAIAPPLGIGTLVLDDGTTVKGFLAEGYACAEATDITHHGGWRAYLGAQQAQQSQQ
ncbi:MAG: allophanate hydrolase [Proteobacteria bacterium]|nr:allophanate hydrolase [Pseudomonadota bacterium]